jgi:hypothetical protein
VQYDRQDHQHPEQDLDHCSSSDQVRAPRLLLKVARAMRQRDVGNVVLTAPYERDNMIDRAGVGFCEPLPANMTFLLALN